MVRGKNGVSPIVKAIAEAEKGTTAEIRVHLSRRWTEKDPFAYAQRLFEEFGMSKTANRNAVLLYVNLRRRKFAIVGDTGVTDKVGQRYWEQVAKVLAEDLHSTYYENAIAMAVITIGVTLKKHFPLEHGRENPNELSDEVTSD